MNATPTLSTATRRPFVPKPDRARIRRLFTCWLLAAVVLSSRGAGAEFDFKDAKGVNNVAFKLEAPLETINGTATGVSGKVTFDPENPAAVRGKIVVATSSLHVPNPKMKGHLHSAMWMDVARYPEIAFEVVSAKPVKTEANVSTVEVIGKMTIKGTTKQVTVPVQLTYLKDKLKAREGKEGDLLVLRAVFQVKRSDYGINAGMMQDKVADQIQLTLGAAGSAPRT